MEYGIPMGTCGVWYTYRYMWSMVYLWVHVEYGIPMGTCGVWYTYRYMWSMVYLWVHVEFTIVFVTRVSTSQQTHITRVEVFFE